MKKRLTNDDEILRMLKEGKTQKEIAQYFGVSPVAIHKRIKRLIPLPESLRKLTQKEQKLCIEKVKGKSNIQAVMQSHDVTSKESAKSMASQLMVKPEIQTAITDLMEHHGLTKSYRIQKLKNHVDNRDPNVSLKALDMSFKLDNSYPPERRINLNIDAEIPVPDLSEYQ